MVKYELNGVFFKKNEKYFVVLANILFKYTK